MKRHHSKITQIDKGSLKRILGVGDLFAVGYGDLGSSIYYALGITAFYALGATPLALALAGFVFCCTALTYAELSSMLRDSGGSATYTRHAFNDLISFIAGWGLLLDFIVTIAISASSIAPYLGFFLNCLKQADYKIGLTVFLIGVLFVINLVGTKSSTKMSWWLTSLTVCTQLLIIVIGAIFLLNTPDLIHHLKINVKNSSYSPTWAQFWKGTAMAMVAYTGIESMAQLSGEARVPSKTVPKAILWAMGMLLVVYLGMSVVALSALTPQVLSTEFLEDPIAGIVSKLPFGSQLLGAWIGLLGAIILFVAANAGLIGASRLSFHMGEHYQLPHFFNRLHPRFKTPFISLAFFALVAIFIVVISRGRLTFLATLYNFGAMLAFFSAHVSLIILRLKKPHLKRPFKIPFNLRLGRYTIPITALIGAATTFSVWVLVIITKPDGRYLGFAWILLGVIIYALYRKKQDIHLTGKVEIEKIKIPGFKPAQYRNILVPTRGGRETQTVQMACEIAKTHGACVTAVHVIEIPFSLPLQTPLHRKAAMAEGILKRAEAIGREFNVGMKLQSIQARSIEGAILGLILKEEFDLLVMGTPFSKNKTTSYSPLVEKILKGSSCPVLLCCGGIQS